jgi:uncharacterized protein (DUF1810 family)
MENTRENNPEIDPHDLTRFISAQADQYAIALAEISAGRKRSHWMWFIFPQFEGLGQSAMSRRYAIRSAAEAWAYLAHPLLGSRLLRCCEAALAGATGVGPTRSATEIFGSPDDMKLRSSATLFASVSPPGSVFAQLLDRYFDGQPDPQTLALIAAAGAE